MTDPPLKGWERLAALVHEVEARKSAGREPSAPLFGAEVGVSMGWTSERLLREFPTLLLWMIDWWDCPANGSDYAKSGDSHAHLRREQQAEHRWTAEQRTLFAKERRRIMASDSVAAADRLVGGTLDFAFIDGDHTHSGVLRDCRAYWPKVRTGGLIAGHDFCHPRDRRGLWGVGRAAQEFCLEAGVELQGDEKATLWWAWKPAARVDS